MNILEQLRTEIEDLISQLEKRAEDLPNLTQLERRQLLRDVRQLSVLLARHQELTRKETDVRSRSPILPGS